MVLNGLGFLGQRLYLYPEYYEKVPVSKLIGGDIQPSDLNDDVLGATLDAIYHYGPTELFNEIVLEIMNHEDLGSQLLHADTTSFNVQGEYECDDEAQSIEITLRHSKDGRMDLNQFVLSLVSNQHGIPMLVQAHSGDSSDKRPSSRRSGESKKVWTLMMIPTSLPIALFIPMKTSITWGIKSPG